MQNFQRLSIFNIVTSNLKNKFKKLKNLINRHVFVICPFPLSFLQLSGMTFSLRKILAIWKLRDNASMVLFIFLLGRVHFTNSCPVDKSHNYLFKIIFGLPQSVTDFEVILAYMDINGGQNHYNFILLHFMGHSTLYKKMNFPLRIFSLCVRPNP